MRRFAAGVSILLAILLGAGAACAEPPMAGLAPVAGVEPPPATAPSPSPSSPSDPPRTHRNSPGLIAAGIVLTTVGSGGLGVAFYLAASAEDEEDTIDFARAALVTLFVSGGLVGAGIPMIVVGAREVPATSEEASPAAPHITVGPFGVRGTF